MSDNSANDEDCCDNNDKKIAYGYVHSLVSPEIFIWLRGSGRRKSSSGERGQAPVVDLGESSQGAKTVCRHCLPDLSTEAIKI